jgi:hypothetical protein
MAKSGSNVVGLTVTDSGAVARELKTFLEGDIAVTIEPLLEETHGFGAAWAETTYTGVRRPADVTLQGWYDDVSNGPSSLFAGAEGATRALVVTWASGKTTSVSVILGAFTRTATRGALTKFTQVLRPTGAVTEA